MESSLGGAIDANGSLLLRTFLSAPSSSSSDELSNSGSSLCLLGTNTTVSSLILTPRLNGGSVVGASGATIATSGLPSGDLVSSSRGGALFLLGAGLVGAGGFVSLSGLKPGGNG